MMIQKSILLTFTLLSCLPPTLNTMELHLQTGDVYKVKREDLPSSSAPLSTQCLAQVLYSSQNPNQSLEIRRATLEENPDHKNVYSSLIGGANTELACFGNKICFEIGSQAGFLAFHKFHFRANSAYSNPDFEIYNGEYTPLKPYKLDFQAKDTFGFIHQNQFFRGKMNFQVHTISTDTKGVSIKTIEDKSVDFGNDKFDEIDPKFSAVFKD